MGWASRANTNPNKGKEKPVKTSGKPILLFAGIDGLMAAFSGKQGQYSNPQRRYK
jgi:hypothetical protein